MSTLLITNGDSAVDLLKDAGRDAEFLPWRDVLHEGPIVPGGLAACTAARAPWLAGRFFLEPEPVQASMAERDRTIDGHAAFDTIELWFEHDLYDQLQLAQILSALAEAGRDTDVVLVQADDFLGHQRPDTVLRFADKARALEAADYSAGAHVWSALAASTPSAVVDLLTDGSIDRLPFMRPALQRFLLELPGTTDGLGLSERHALDLLSEDGAMPMSDLFRGALEREEAAFMGDWNFSLLIRDLAGCELPLVSGGIEETDADDPFQAFQTATVDLTDAGRVVLAGRLDHLSVNRIDRWWAGTHLASPDVWRFDRETGKLAPPAPADA